MLYLEVKLRNLIIFHGILKKLLRITFPLIKVYNFYLYQLLKVCQHCYRTKRITHLDGKFSNSKWFYCFVSTEIWIQVSAFELSWTEWEHWESFSQTPLRAEWYVFKVTTISRSIKIYEYFIAGENIQIWNQQNMQNRLTER